MRRRDFLKNSVGIVGLGLLGSQLANCSGGGGGDGTGGGGGGTTNTCALDPVTALTQGAHPSAPHTLSLTQAQITSGINSGTPQVYTVSTASGHNHDVTLTVNQLTMIQNKQSVTGLVTTTVGHSHVIDVTCT